MEHLILQLLRRVCLLKLARRVVGYAIHSFGWTPVLQGGYLPQKIIDDEVSKWLHSYFSYMVS